MKDTDLTPAIVSKAEFARLLNVSKARVSQFIDAGYISSSSLVGEGRNARIDVDRARWEITSKRDPAQAHGNGLRTKLGSGKPKDSSPTKPPRCVAEVTATTGGQATLIRPDPRVLALLLDLPSSIAWVAVHAGVAPHLAYAVAYAVQVDLVGASLLDHGVVVEGTFTPTDWRRLLAEYDIAEQVDLAAWERQRDQFEDLREKQSVDAHLAGAKR